jgi:hypothetical protein
MRYVFHFRNEGGGGNNEYWAKNCGLFSVSEVKQGGHLAKRNLDADNFSIVKDGGTTAA